MNYRINLFFYILVLHSITFLLVSCGSIVDPMGVPGSSEERILFLKVDRALTEICSIKPDGTDIQTIASHDMAGEFVGQGYYDAKWSPDKRRIAIKGGPRKSIEYNPLWLMDNDGNLIKRLTSNGGIPHWSNDGNEILFARPTHARSVLVDYYIINIHTLSERLALSAEPPYWWGGVDWSSDGQYILTNQENPYDNEEGGSDFADTEIIQLHLHDGEKIQLTSNDVRDYGAIWSPDEFQIVYSSGGNLEGYQVKLMNSDGSGETTIIDTLASYGAFNWSPNGDKIAFTKVKKLDGWMNYAQGSDLFVYDMISGEVKQLTNFAADSIHVFVKDWK